MKKSRSILVTVFARAAWGGLHEHVLDEVRGLICNGFDVHVACSESRLAVRLRGLGAGVITVDWDDLDDAAVRIFDVLEHIDLVHAHPFTSRLLGLRISSVVGCPIIVTMHGNYLDYAISWASKVDHIVFVSEALRDNFLANVKGIEASRTSVIPNGVSDAIFHKLPLSLTEKKNQNFLRIAVASRLDSDKAHIIQSTVSVAEQVREAFPSSRIAIDVLGEGNLSRDVMSELAMHNIDVRMLGWRISEHVCYYLRRAIVSVCPGRSAAQSLAVGTPVFAVGSQGPTGLQVGKNLINGLWSNFGGYPVDSFESGQEVLELLSDKSAYRRAQIKGRISAELLCKQSTVDGKLVSLINTLMM